MGETGGGGMRPDEARNSKFQAPSSREIPNSKIQFGGQQQAIVVHGRADGSGPSVVGGDVLGERRRGFLKNSSARRARISCSRSENSRLGSSRVSSAATALAQASRYFWRLRFSLDRRERELTMRA